MEAASGIFSIIVPHLSPVSGKVEFVVHGFFRMVGGTLHVVLGRGRGLGTRPRLKQRERERAMMNEGVGTQTSITR